MDEFVIRCDRYTDYVEVRCHADAFGYESKDYGKDSQGIFKKHKDVVFHSNGTYELYTREKQTQPYKLLFHWDSVYKNFAFNHMKKHAPKQQTENPFKPGDRVYVYHDGWGIVSDITGKDCSIVGVERIVEGSNEKAYYNYSLVSFTEYDPIKGGLSHDRDLHLKTGWRFDKDFKLKHGYTKEDREDALHFASKVVGETKPGWNEYEPARNCAKKSVNLFDFDLGDVKFKLEGHDVESHLVDRMLSKSKDPKHEGEYDIKESKKAERNFKALNYIKKLLLDNYDITDDYVGVEDLGEEINVSLTFRKG